jgi:hypothetical protein
MTCWRRQYLIRWERGDDIGIIITESWKWVEGVVQLICTPRRRYFWRQFIFGGRDFLQIAAHTAFFSRGGYLLFLDGITCVDGLRWWMGDCVRGGVKGFLIGFGCWWEVVGINRAGENMGLWILGNGFDLVAKDFGFGENLTFWVRFL